MTCAQLCGRLTEAIEEQATRVVPMGVGARKGMEHRQYKANRRIELGNGRRTRGRSSASTAQTTASVCHVERYHRGEDGPPILQAARWPPVGERMPMDFKGTDSGIGGSGLLMSIAALAFICAHRRSGWGGCRQLTQPLHHGAQALTGPHHAHPLALTDWNLV